MKLRVLLTLMMAIAAIAGCKPAQGEIVIRPAPIHEIRVDIAESNPPQVKVYIKGGLSDGCTTFNEMKTTRTNKVITIEITTQRPRDAVCTQVYGYFDKTEDLGSDFTVGEVYTLNINDKSTVFFIQR
ncbi:MAG: hypothetical protein PHR56_05865 [Dehalococcoidales bacterium]|nr:hypothetical protein [Dehalococcoidales bacterium]